MTTFKRYDESGKQYFIDDNNVDPFQWKVKDGNTIVDSYIKHNTIKKIRDFSNDPNILGNVYVEDPINNDNTYIAIGDKVVDDTAAINKHITYAVSILNASTNPNKKYVINFRNKYRVTHSNKTTTPYWSYEAITNGNTRADGLILNFHEGSEIFYDPDFSKMVNTIYSYQWAIKLYGDNIQITGCCNITNKSPDILWDDKFYIHDDNDIVNNQSLNSLNIKNLIAIEIRGDAKTDAIRNNDNKLAKYNNVNVKILSDDVPYWGTSFANQQPFPPNEDIKYGKNNVIEGVTCKNFRTSLKMLWCSDSKIQYCNIKNGTTTNISCVQCGDNMEISHNIGTNGGDDIFAIGTQEYRICNNLSIHDNYFENTGGSCVAYNGYSNVNIYNNYFRNSSSGLIKIWLEFFKFIKGHNIYNNYLVDGGRAWNPNYPKTQYKDFKLPWLGSEACAIRLYYYDPKVVQDKLLYEDVNIYNNHIINPQTVGISILKGKNINIYDNLFYKGISNKYSYEELKLYEDISTDEQYVNRNKLPNKAIVVWNYTNLTVNGVLQTDSPLQTITITNPPPPPYYIGDINNNGEYFSTLITPTAGTYNVKANEIPNVGFEEFKNKKYINDVPISNPKKIPVIYDVGFDTVYPSVFINQSVIKWWVKEGYEFEDLKNNKYEKLYIRGQLIDSIEIYHINYNIIGINWTGVQSGIIYTDEYNSYMTYRYELINIRNIPDKYLTFTSNEFLQNVPTLDNIPLTTTPMSIYKNKFNLMIGRKVDNKVVEGYRWNTRGNMLESSGFYTDDGNNSRIENNTIIKREIPQIIQYTKPNEQPSLKIYYTTPSNSNIQTILYTVNSFYIKSYVNTSISDYFTNILDLKILNTTDRDITFGFDVTDPIGSRINFKSSTLQSYQFEDLTPNKTLLPALGIPFESSSNKSITYNKDDTNYTTIYEKKESYPNEIVVSNVLRSSAYNNLNYIYRNIELNAIAGPNNTNLHNNINKSRVIIVKMTSDLDLSRAVIYIDRMANDRYYLNIIDKGDSAYNGYNFTISKTSSKEYVLNIEIPLQRTNVNDVIEFNEYLNNKYYLSFTFDNIEQYAITNIIGQTYINNYYRKSFGTIL